MTKFKFKPPKGVLEKGRQIVTSIIIDVKTGVLKKDDRLPSINDFSRTYNVSRDTVEKAYIELRKLGYVNAIRAVGYFITGKTDNDIKILLAFNKLSDYKKIVYDNFVKTIGKNATVDLFIHHYDIKLLKNIVEERRDHYQYYVVMPHFTLETGTKDYVPFFKKFKKGELILLDKDIPYLGEKRRGVVQDFENDIYKALKSDRKNLAKYKSIKLVIPGYSNHPQDIRKGTKQYCLETRKKFVELNDLDRDNLVAGNLYIIILESDLAELIKRVQNSAFKLGKEIGIISFNETVLKEVLNITVITTDFEQMGISTARMLLENQQGIHINPFKMIKRQST